MNKIKLIFLTALLLFSCITLPTLNADTIQAYQLPCRSTIVEEENIKILTKDGELYMSLGDISKYTNTETVLTGEEIQIKQGIRIIQINIKDSTMTEELFKEKIPIKIYKQDEQYFLPAKSILTYLGSTLSFANDSLYIGTPKRNVFSELAFDKNEYILDHRILWNSETEYQIMKGLNIIMDWLYGTTADEGIQSVLKNGIIDVLAVDISKYEEVKNLIKEDDNYYQSIMKFYENEPDLVETVINSKDFSNDPMGFVQQLTIQTGDIKDSIQYLLDVRNLKNIVLENADDMSGISMSTGLNYLNLETTRQRLLASCTESKKSFQHYYEISKQGSFKDYHTNAVLKAINSSLNNSMLPTVEEFIQLSVNTGIQDKVSELLISPEIELSFNIAKYLVGLKESDYINTAREDLRAKYLVAFLYDVENQIDTYKESIYNNLNKETLCNYKGSICFWLRTMIETNNKLMKVAEYSNSTENIKLLEERNKELSKKLYSLYNSSVFIPNRYDVCAKTDAQLTEIPDKFKISLHELTSSYEWIVEPLDTIEDIQTLDYSRFLFPFLPSNFSDYDGINYLISNGKQGLIDYDGRILVNPDKDLYFCFEGIAELQGSSLYDPQGGIHVHGGHGGPGGYVYVKENNKMMVIATAGIEDLSQNDYKNLNEDFTEGRLYRYLSNTNDFNSKQCVFMSKDYKKAEPVYEEGYCFRNGLAAVKLNGKWGFINQEGIMVIPAQYDTVYSFKGDLTAVCLKGEWMFIDKQNQPYKNMKFEKACTPYNGKAWVKVNGKWGVIKI